MKNKKLIELIFGLIILIIIFYFGLVFFLIYINRPSEKSYNFTENIFKYHSGIAENNGDNYLNVSQAMEIIDRNYNKSIKNMRIIFMNYT